jgi:uncharacterized protein YbaP (TraB family)
MANRSFWFLGLGVWLLLSEPAPGGNYQGIFFACQRAGEPTSHLLGTMHSGDPRVLAVAAEVEDALRASRRLVLEIVPDGAAALKTLVAGFLPSGRRLSNLVEPQVYEQVVAVAAARGIDRKLVDRMKPWYLALTLSLPKHAGVALDLRLFHLAEEWGTDVFGLESVAEQLSLFEDLPLAEQVVFLEQVVKNRDAMPKQLEAMVGAYVAGDLAQLEALGFAQVAGFDPAMLTWFREQLVIQRNIRMGERLSDHLQGGGAFVAVGALHLVGETGLIRVMQRSGCQLRRIR